MGYGTRGGAFGGKISTFEPDNTEKVLYINTTYITVGLDEVLGKIREHFGVIPFGRFDIDAEYIHTDCLGYDSYDPGDYSNYIKITLRDE